MKLRVFKSLAAACICFAVIAATADARDFNVPAGDLKAALDAYIKQAGIALMYSGAAVRGAHSEGVKGSLSADDALSQLLRGTGFAARDENGGIVIVHDGRAALDDFPSMQIAASAAPASSASGASLETVTVTSSKIGGDVQNIPISITALSQEQLTATQTVGGPDLVKQVPNFNFSKTNFTGYNIQIRGIGTQAISVTTDPAVAVAFNDIPFIRNHFFEQEFYDVGQLEVLRGPQGTLYGRNATAGVVNLVSAKPTDQFEAMAAADVGNYGERRLEGMINIPVADDTFDIRLAGEWTKRQGYTFDETTDQRVDGRDLWSTRMTLGMKPFEHVQAYLVWEHFNESDDRERSTKQLCDFDPGADSVGPLNQSFDATEGFAAPTHFSEGQIFTNLDRGLRDVLSQGCLPGSLYSPASYRTPNGGALPIVYAAQLGGAGAQGAAFILGTDPYASDNQSQNLRVIQSELTPLYKAKNDTIEFNVDYALTPALTLSSQTGYNHDFLASEEDFNRFNSTPGIFFTSADQVDTDGYSDGHTGVLFTPGGVLCDPQLGCSTKFVGEDLSQERAWQLNQEIRLTSNFSGPLNFSAGANYMHYETLEDYYVFLNLLTLESRFLDGPSAIVSEHSVATYTANGLCLGLPQQQTFPSFHPRRPLNSCPFTDGTPLTPGFDGQGHNYFRSINPYVLNSYAGFGEVTYQALDDLKFTGGLRWTDDEKHFVEVPSEVLITGWGYPVAGVVNQQWKEWTGRAVANWTPKLDFTDQTLVYASFARGYKAGGANPPAPNFFAGTFGGSATHPLTFAPEFINAFELGTKDTMLDGALTVNGDVFYYDYKGYQISEIVDRTSINLNFDANVRGAEIETSYEPIPGLRFNFAGGWEDGKLASGSQAVDLMDRTAGHTDWQVVKPSIIATSNCILPKYVLAELVAAGLVDKGGDTPDAFLGVNYFISSLQFAACQTAYSLHKDPVEDSFLQSLFGGTLPPSGFDPATAPNNGEGFDKNLAGNRLPNTPPFTVSFGAQYTLPITSDWAGTLRGDYYWQDYSWARVFNDNPYDRLRGYTNVNLTLILTNQDGWQVMLYDKNVFDTTAITGAFLNSDDTALTTNVFVTDPKLIGIRVTKNW